MRKILIGLMALVFLSACMRQSAQSTRPVNAVVRGVNYVGVSVSDLDQSTHFYSKAADLKLVENGVISDNPVFDALVGRSGVRATTRLLKGSNAQLRYMQFDELSAPSRETPQVEVHGPGIAHVCFQVAKETKVYDNFLAAGATPVGAPEMVQLNPARPVEYAYARDSDDIMFEVEHVDIAALDLDEPPKNKYRIRHVAISTPDIDRAVEFYSTLLEQKKPRRIGRWFSLSGEKFDKVSGLAETKMEMAWFQIRNLELEIAQYISHPTKTPTEPRPVDALGYNMIVFDVTNLGSAREKLIAAGGSVVSEPEPMDGGQIMFGRDLDGNLLGFQVVASEASVSSQNFESDGT